MEPLIIILAILTFVFTLIGGLITLKFRKSLPYFFAFSAGTLIAVAFLNILPETIDLANEISFPIKYSMIIIVAAFFIYSLVDKFFVTHCIGNQCDQHGHIMGPIGAGSLIFHSFLDGAAIGAAFLINPSAGLILAIAVISHNFTDGINTVALMLKNKQKIRKTVVFLFMDALAPVLGVLLTTLITIPLWVLVILLSLFMGEFLYLGAAHLLPEIREHPSKKVLFAMALGILIIALLAFLI